MAVRRVLGITAGVITLVALQATAGSPTATPMQDAVYASRVPLYPGARLRESNASTWVRSLFGPPAAQRRSWSFAVHAGEDRVVDFYESRLRAARRDRTDSGVSFAFVPADADPGEMVMVTVGPGVVQVEEVTLFR